MCDCGSCRTGKCGCPQCRAGAGIDFEGNRLRIEALRRDIVLERIRIRDDRAPSVERQRVRRWGDITPGTPRERINQATDKASQETGDEDHD